MVNEIEINAKFNTLIDQRNSAMNQVVNLAGDLASAHTKIGALEAKINDLESKVVELSKENEQVDSDEKLIFAGEENG